jgi:hypothetical protein
VAKTIQAALPKGAKTVERFAPRLEATVRRGASDPSDKTPKSGRGYTEQERESMDAKVENSR